MDKNFDLMTPLLGSQSFQVKNRSKNLNELSNEKCKKFEMCFMKILNHFDKTKKAQLLVDRFCFLISLSSEVFVLNLHSNSSSTEDKGRAYKGGLQFIDL